MSAPTTPTEHPVRSSKPSHRTSSRRSYRRRALGLAVAAAVAALAVVAVSTFGPSAVVTPAAAVEEAVATSAAAAADSVTWRVTNEYGDQGEQGFKMTNVTETRITGEDVAVTIEHPEDSIAADALEAFDRLESVRRVDGQLYVRMRDGVEGYRGWYTYDGADAAALPETLTASATDVEIDELLDLRDAERMDTTIANGVELTRYRAPNGVADVRDPAVLGRLGTGLLAENFPRHARREMGFDVWIDGAGLLRRIEIDRGRAADFVYDIDSDAPDIIDRTVIELSDYGSTKMVTAPDDVTTGQDVALTTAGSPQPLNADGELAEPSDDDVMWSARDVLPEGARSDVAPQLQRVRKQSDRYAVLMSPQRTLGGPTDWIDEYRLIDGRLYAHFVDDYVGHDGWVDVIGFGELPFVYSPLIADPVIELDELEAGDALERINTKTIDGVKTTHYRARNGIADLGDIERIGQFLSGSALALGDILTDADGNAVNPNPAFDAWVDDNGVIRRFHVTDPETGVMRVVKFTEVGSATVAVPDDADKIGSEDLRYYGM